MILSRASLAPISAPVAALVLLLGGAGAAWAQSPGTQSPGAASQGGQDATYDRLFGSGAATGVPSAVPETPSLVPIWLVPVLLMAAAAGGFWYMRQREIARPAGSLRVLQRQPLGDRSAVVLLEYAEPSGEIRRYLIGTGGGSPSLLVDLGIEAELAAQGQATGQGQGQAIGQSQAQAQGAPSLEEPAIPANRAAGWSRPEVYRPSDVRAPEVRGEPRPEGRADSILELRKQAASKAASGGTNIADEILAERRDPRDAARDGRPDGKPDGERDGRQDGRRDEFSRVLARIGEEEER